MAALIAEAKAAGARFVVVEQNLAFAELIADRYLVIDRGGSPSTGAAMRSSAARCCAICTCERPACAEPPPHQSWNASQSSSPWSRSRTRPGSAGS
jgi:hypothetical protein